GDSPVQPCPVFLPYATLFRSRLAVDLDHAADDVGAERAVAAAHAQRLAVPAMGQARRFGYRYQTRARISAGDGDVGLAADVLLAEHLQVVLLELAGTGQRGAGGFGRQPARQGGIAHGPGGHAEAVALAADAGAGRQAAATGLVVVAQGGQQAAAGQAVHAGAAGIAAQQAQRVAGAEAEGRVQRLAAEAPGRTRRTGAVATRRLQQQQGLDLAAALVPHRQHGLLGTRPHLAMRA